MEINTQNSFEYSSTQTNIYYQNVPKLVLPYFLTDTHLQIFNTKYYIYYILYILLY